MLKLLKYLPAVLAFRDVTETYKDKEDKEKPLLLRRRVVGATITAVSVAASVVLNLEIDKEQVNRFIDLFNATMANLYQIYDLITIEVIPAVMAMYGILLTIIGKIKADLRKKVVEGK